MHMAVDSTCTYIIPLTVCTVYVHEPKRPSTSEKVCEGVLAYCSVCHWHGILHRTRLVTMHDAMDQDRGIARIAVTITQ